MHYLGCVKDFIASNFYEILIVPCIPFFMHIVASIYTSSHRSRFRGDS
jgi:hypothetical protein